MAETKEPKQIKYYHCSKCNRTLNEVQFYTYRDGTKTEMCKKCLTMHIDPFDESTFIWLLQKMDVAYVPIEWNTVRDRDYAKNPTKANPTAIFGKYLSKMKLKQYKQFDFAHSDEACKVCSKNNGTCVETKEEIDPEFEAEMKAKFEAGEISEAQYKTLVSTETLYKNTPPEDYIIQPTAPPHPYNPPVENPVSRGSETPHDIDMYNAAVPPDEMNFYNEDNFIKEEDLPDLGAGLTEEDKIYLAMKWGRLYKPSEWVELEQKYKEMTESFDIQDSDTTGTLILICKTYLKMNQAVDVGDMDSFQKLSRVYESLRKSANFTAAQNKAQSTSFVTSVGEIVNYCEREGGKIPRYEIDEPYDKVDKIIDDLKEYNRNLIYSDTTLAAQIEDYLKQKAILDQKKYERSINNGKEFEINNEDYQAYFDQINADLESDMEQYNEQ